MNGSEAHKMWSVRELGEETVSIEYRRMHRRVEKW
jgi:hypothetical protein